VELATNIKQRKEDFKRRQAQQKLYDLTRLEEQREIKVYMEVKRQEFAEVLFECYSCI
jgi:hypothetical protein